MRGKDGQQRDRWLVAAVPILLTIVALTQMTIATTGDLTPWRGAGFGMFSTLDGHDLRGVRVEVVDGDGNRRPTASGEVGRDDDVRREMVRARAWPTDARVQRLARTIARAPLLYDNEGQVHVAPLPDRDGDDEDEDDPDIVGAIDDVDEVTVEIHRLWFDRYTGVVEPEVIADLSVAP